MKKIIGLDLGVSSIGWAVVYEAETAAEKSSIIASGERTNMQTIDDQKNYEQGKSVTTNADRTLKRTMRRNLFRYRLRRQHLIDSLKQAGIITSDTPLYEQGNATTFETYRLRARAATERIELGELARVLLMINKKRGYKSNRKANSGDEGQIVDGMTIAKKLYEESLTPGQYVLQLLRSGKNYVPDFYRSDLQHEFDSIWAAQQPYHSDILTDDFKLQLSGKGKEHTKRIFLGRYKLYTADNKGTTKEKRLTAYKWRVEALTRQLSTEELAYVISDINGQINNSSGYLGAISDRSKALYFNRQTVGQALMAGLAADPHFSVANKVFYRQDYLDEFEAIWETQAQHHAVLTPELKKEIRDIVIFYQRNLKSQKGLIAYCELESQQREVVMDGKTKTIATGSKVCPKSSPLFQEFKIWQVLNNLVVIDYDTTRPLTLEEKQLLAAELTLRPKLPKSKVLKLLFPKQKGLDLNYDEIEGNHTMAALFAAYSDILVITGHEECDFSKMTYSQVLHTVNAVFAAQGFNTDILTFNTTLSGHDLERQPLYALWHLLYSYAGDNTATGVGKLLDKLRTLYGFDEESAKRLARVSFKPDYGRLSAKAIRRILPFMKEGKMYSDACQLAGYNHSKRSLTREDLDNKVYKDRLDPLPKNSLHNPVVEKILNQTINVVNALVDAYGKPDEIRIELARELKKSAEERAEMTDAINAATAERERIRTLLQQPPFNLQHVSRNDILRYRLYQELKENGYKTLYSNTYIPEEELFSKKFDIEHILPQALFFDDSFANKTLEARDVNLNKSKQTAYDYVESTYGADGLARYKAKLQDLLNAKVISKTKHQRLMTTKADIPQDFINRDLRDTQYISRKTREILEQLVPTVVATTGAITDRLRDDWQLVNVMQELNWDKYNRLGLTETFQDKDGRRIRRIKDWTKRNDHRHHAMDALTIAFTKPAIIQYLNNLNARSDKSSSIYAIQEQETYIDKHGHRCFLPPMPLDEFRAAAKAMLEQSLVSIKAKNKVVTRNVNKTKRQGGTNRRIELTPRGQLHNETVYGAVRRYATKEEKVGSAFTAEHIALVASKRQREALLQRLAQYGGDPKKAFTGKNSLEKNPLFLDAAHSQQVPPRVKLVELATIYTKREPVGPDLNIDKVLDPKIKALLEQRIQEFGGNKKAALSNLDENPIWLNREKGIAVKRVTITGVSEVVALHDKRNHRGELILTPDGKRIPTDFVSTSNNHHVAIFRDDKGNLQEHIVSFYEATACAIQGLPVIDKTYNSSEGWQFVFTMKRNEYFVFPNPETGFDPNEIDLMNPKNYAEISPNLFRVQKLATKNYVFRHHLETTVEEDKVLRNITWKRIQNVNGLKGMVKVRINHIGQIVAVGEY